MKCFSVGQCRWHTLGQTEAPIPAVTSDSDHRVLKVLSLTKRLGFSGSYYLEALDRLRVMISSQVYGSGFKLSSLGLSLPFGEWT